MENEIERERFDVECFYVWVGKIVFCILLIKGLGFGMSGEMEVMIYEYVF